MITVAYLKKILAKLPDDALVYAYEGEITGIIVMSKDGDHHLTAIMAGAKDEIEDEDEVRHA